MPEGVLHTQHLRADLVRRLHCAEGHVKGIAAMVERGADCESIVRQILAVQAALREVDRLVVRHHLHECLGSSTGDDAERTLDEVLRLYQLTRA